jgi:succinoglycan biosynthesis transport protein ExoP
MDLTALFGVLRRRGWVVLVVTMIAALTAGILSFYVLTPIYASSATVLVIKKDTPITDYSTLLLNRNLTRTYGEIAKSRSVAERVIKELNLGISTANLLSRTTVSPVRDTEILQIKVEDSSPLMARLIASRMAEAFIAQVESIMKVENVRIIDPPVEPTRPDAPRPLLNVVVAGFLGLMIGAALMFVLEYLDSSLKSSEDVERHLAVPALGMIPEVRDLGTPGGSLVARAAPRSQAAEGFRVLRTNIHFVGLDKPARSILVTSAVAGEGKSFTAANLAVAMAQAGQRVLLVDADLRRPSLHRLFGLTSDGTGTGLTTAIASPLGAETPVQATAIENLHILTSGPLPPNPSELLGSTRMAHLVERLKREYDTIVIDSPPVLAVADAAICAAYADGVLLVVGCGRTRYQLVQMAQKTLERVHARTLGVVLDRVKADGRGSYYYYYGYDGHGASERPGARRHGTKGHPPSRR